MNRLILIVLGMMLCAPVHAAEDAKKNDVREYLQQLQLKLDHMAQRANQPSAQGASVVGVRGTSQQEPLSKQLYWKGRKGQVAVTTDEVKAFRAAVAQAQVGKTAEATAALQDFLQKYPKSALLPDAQETLKKLGEAPAPAKA